MCDYSKKLRFPWSSKLLPPTSSKSSAGRLSICGQCCKPLWNQQLDSAMPTRRTLFARKMGHSIPPEAYGYSREFLDYMKHIPINAERGSASGRALVEGRVVHTDAAGDPEYTLVEAR